jgi:hypothetical protein
MDNLKDLQERTIRAFYQGMRSGVNLYAHWKDGEQYVGTTGKTLRKALAEIAVDEMKDLDGLKAE